MVSQNTGYVRLQELGARLRRTTLTPVSSSSLPGPALREGLGPGRKPLYQHQWPSLSNGSFRDLRPRRAGNPEQKPGFSPSLQDPMHKQASQPHLKSVVPSVPCFPCVIPKSSKWLPVAGPNQPTRSINI